MKVVFGILMIVAGVLFGLWAGVWWAFIGGIVDVVDGIKAVDTDAGMIAIGAAKVFFAVAIGWLSALLLIIPGMVIAEFDLK